MQFPVIPRCGSGVFFKHPVKIGEIGNSIVERNFFD
jgi:hypothetical protein